MVALPSSTVAAGTASMVAWAVWTLVLLTGLVHAHASPEERFNGDVSDDDTVIDKLKDLWNSRQHVLRQLPPSPSLPRHQSANEKIEFAVPPQDERYFRPPTPSRHDPPQANSDLLHYLSPDLNLQPHLDYHGELLQYQDEDPQYPSEYPAHYRPLQYHQQELRLPSYLSHQDLPYRGGLYPAALQDPRQLGEEDEEEAVREEVEEAREALRKGLVDEDDYNSNSQLMMKKGEVKEDEDAKENNKENAAALTMLTSPKAATSQPETMSYMHLRRAPAANLEASYRIQQPPGSSQQAQLSDLYFTALVAGCTAVAVCGVVGAGICWYRLNKSHRAAQDAEYPAYGVTGPNKDLSPSGDRKLAQSAHMYHYQHQKQQMIALEKSSGGERHGSASDVDSEEEGEENEYTVYECPGLAPTGEMEVKNPLFHDDPTPATPSIRKEAEQNHDHHDEDKSNK